MSNYLLYDDELRLAQVSPEPVGIGQPLQRGCYFSENRARVSRGSAPMVPARTIPGAEYLAEEEDADNPQWRDYRDLATFRAVSPGQFPWQMGGEGRLVTLQELGVRDKGEYADYFAYELYLKGGLLRRLAGALEAAEDFLSARKAGLGVLPVALAAAGSVVSGASLLSKVGGLISGFNKSKTNERRQKNAEAGAKRLETNGTKPLVALYGQLVTALAQRGVRVEEQASEIFYDPLIKTLWKGHSSALTKYIRSDKHLYRGPLYGAAKSSFLNRMKAALAAVKKIPATRPQAQAITVSVAKPPAAAASTSAAQPAAAPVSWLTQLTQGLFSQPAVQASQAMAPDSDTIYREGQPEAPPAPSRGISAPVAIGAGAIGLLALYMFMKK